MNVPRRLLRPLVVAGVALGMVATAAVFRDAPSVAPVTPAGRAGAASVRLDGGQGVAALQARLERLPADAGAWAALSAEYVQQARTTSDPSLYARAEAAVARSFELAPSGNDPALVARATLAAARHDFAAARRDATEARRVNPYSATALGVLADALVELGEYDAAFDAIQRMVDLKPSVSSLTRASYSFELRGDLNGARYALERTLEIAAGPADVAFARRYLGELAWNAGDVASAARHYEAGLRADPESAALLAGRARTRAATGDAEGAVRDYEAAVTRLPLPEHLIEYADLLVSLGRGAEAERLREVVVSTRTLQEDAGVNADLELALYEADHGDPAVAVAAAGREYARRRSIHADDAYAWALHAAGRDREALPYARRAVRLGTRSAVFRFHLGMIEAALGQRDAARRDLTEALAINPHFSPTQSVAARETLAALR